MCAHSHLEYHNDCPCMAAQLGVHCFRQIFRLGSSQRIDYERWAKVEAVSKTAQFKLSVASSSLIYM